MKPKILVADNIAEEGVSVLRPEADVEVKLKLKPAELIDIIGNSPLAARVTLFDVYTGKQVPQGKKSLALSISYQSPDRTLTDEEVDKTQGKILERLTKELGATLRG